MQSTQSVAQPQVAKKASEPEQFQIVGNLGKGAYGKVVLAKKGGKLYAIKQIEKKKLAKECKEYQAFVEKELLRKINHPGIIKLVKCYQEPKHLNYVLDYCHGGDFTTFLRFNYKHFTNDMRRFYIAEIVNVLEFLHGVGITHRDLKPENIMLSKDGHLKLIDFGTAEITRCTILDQKFKDDIEKQKKAVAQKKSLLEQVTQANIDDEEVSPRKRRSTFVGTCFYLSPELLEQNICEAPSDLWALGCIIYQLYYMEPPFKAANEYQIFEKIKNVQINFPKIEGITDNAIDLIKKLLVKIPEDRLGANQKQGLMFSDLKAHPFFENINIDTIFTQSVPELSEEEYQQKEQSYRLQKIGSEIEGDHEQLFQQKQSFIYSGMVDTKTFASYSPAYLILQKDFNLVKLTNHHTQSIKLTISPISENTVAQKLADNKLKIIADECTLTIRTPDTDKWIAVLNQEYRKSNPK